MAIRKINIWPDLTLSNKAKPVTDFNEELKQLVVDLFETMFEASGIGLAATQIAVNQRVLVIDLDPHKDSLKNDKLKEQLLLWGYQGPMEYINPRIIEREGSIVWEEGCLSVPGMVGEVKRSDRIKLEAYDREGNKFIVEASDLYAVAIQHELDHLDGVVFVEHLSKLKRDVIKKKMNNLKSNGVVDGVVAAKELQ